MLVLRVIVGAAWLALCAVGYSTQSTSVELRDRLDAARAAWDAKDFSGARTKVAAAIEEALTRLAKSDDESTHALLAEMGRFAYVAGELRAARSAQDRVLELRTRTRQNDHPDVQSARYDLALTLDRLCESKDARALLDKVIEVRTRTLPDDHEDLQAARASLAEALLWTNEFRDARSLFENVVEVRSRALPGEHVDLQRARLGLSRAMRGLGELEGARSLQESAIAVLSRQLPEEDVELQLARLSFAVTRSMLGDLRGARPLTEGVVEVLSRMLPAEHRDVVYARRVLAVVMKSLGDLRGAHAIEKEILEIHERTLPDDHLLLQESRLNVAWTIHQLGDLQGARDLSEKAVEILSRTLPDDNATLVNARQSLAVAMFGLGDLEGSRVLFERILEVRTRTLPDEHPDLQWARGNVAATLHRLGDVEGARVLNQKVFEARARTLPDDHLDLQFARSNLATSMRAVGDLTGARALQEQVLAISARTLPDDHPDLQRARGNLATTLKRLGDREAARVLQEKVLDVRSRTLPDEHPDLLAAQEDYAVTIYELGDTVGARALQEHVLEVRTRTLASDHPSIQTARGNLAATIADLGELEAARELEEQVLAAFLRTLPGDHPTIQVARGNVVWTIARLRARNASTTDAKDRQRCNELVLALCESQTRAARGALLESSAREARARCESFTRGLDVALSVASGCGVFAPAPELDRPAFVLSETTRGGALGAASLMRQAARAPAYSKLKDELRRTSDELAALAQKGGTSSAEFQTAFGQRDTLQRDLAKLARELTGGAPVGLEFDMDALAAKLAAKDAVVGFRQYTRSDLVVTEGSASSARVSTKSAESLVAFVLRRAPDARGVVIRVDLGPITAIEDAVKTWREAVGAGVERGAAASNASPDSAHARGVALRRLVFDPLVPALIGVETAVLALDGVLHLVPIDALPLQDEQAAGPVALVGDRWRIQTRCTLAECLATQGPTGGMNALVALGGASFNSEPLAPSAEDKADVDAASSSPELVASILRGGAWERGFAPLTYTGLEAREVAAIHGEVFEDGGASVVLEKRRASRASLEELAPRARWLHIATHGWFAAESIHSWKDAEPLDPDAAAIPRTSGEEQVKGMSPMLLCGLALAGANLPESALGRVPGLVTAEELSTLDLSNCELAVLSACDTNVGERRAGQGVASLQMALQMAGARSVVTSLWKVPDEATRELMTDFYRRLWVEKKPKAQALWEAKKKLREAQDERGEPRYALRDWAAWVLTGEPD